MNTDVDGMRQSLDAALAQIAFLQRGRCGYCSWGDDEEKTFEELQTHIQECELHPLTQAKQQIARLTAERYALKARVKRVEKELYQAATDSFGDETAIREAARSVLGDVVDGTPSDVVAMVVALARNVTAKLDAAHKDVRALAEALDDISSGELGINVAIKTAKKALARPSVKAIMEAP